jgi:hypothetical protein
MLFAFHPNIWNSDVATLNASFSFTIWFQNCETQTSSNSFFNCSNVLFPLSALKTLFLCNCFWHYAIPITQLLLCFRMLLFKSIKIHLQIQCPSMYKLHCQLLQSMSDCSSSRIFQCYISINKEVILSQHTTSTVNFIEVADALTMQLIHQKYHLTPHVTMMVLLPEHHFLVGYGLRTQSNWHKAACLLLHWYAYQHWWTDCPLL